MKAWGGHRIFSFGHPSRNLLLRNVKGLRTGLPLFQFRLAELPTFQHVIAEYDFDKIGRVVR